MNAKGQRAATQHCRHFMVTHKIAYCTLYLYSVTMVSATSFRTEAAGHMKFDQVARGPDF